MSDAMHEVHLRLQRLKLSATGRSIDNINESVRRGDHFVLPQSETYVKHHGTWRPDGYYRIFCAHDRPYYQTCSQCRRTQSEANDWLLRKSG